MSAALRPSGDASAAFYGAYLSEEEVLRVQAGTSLDMLCNDHMNYRVEVKKNVGGIGHIHFPSWANRYDYKGSLLKLYLAREGTYCLVKDNYYPLQEVEEQKKRIDARGSGLFPTGTRYDDGFLSKPRLSLRRPDEQSESSGRSKRQMDASASTGRRASEGDREAKRGSSAASEGVAATGAGRPQRQRSPRKRYDPDAEEARPSASHRRPSKPATDEERDAEDSDDAERSVGASHESALVRPTEEALHSNFSVLESELGGAEFGMDGGLLEEGLAESLPAPEPSVVPKILVVDEQLEKLREARRCIDDAILRLERIKSAQLAQRRPS